VTFGEGRCCDIVVLPVAPGLDGERTFVVLFEARPPAPAAPRRGRGARATARPRLAAELEASRAALADLLETHRQGEDAVTAAHDELVSANEELQSLNEELETAKEELQASNEELTTVNDELHGRNQELNVVNADLVNLLDAVEIPILIIDEQRRIRRVTRRAEAVLGLTAADLGRRLTEVALPLQAPDLGQWITRAIEVKVLVEAEVQDHDDRWYRLQIRPHYASDGRVDGATLALMDVDDLRHEIVNAEWARDYAHAIVQAVQLPLLVLDAGLRVLSGNAAFFRRFQVEPAGTEGRSFFELAGGAWNTPELRRSTADVLAGRGRFASSVTEHLFPGAGLRATLVTGGAVASPAGGVMIVLAIEDITERLALERHRTEVLALADTARRRAERADAAKDLVLANLSHELRTPLTTILLQAGVLRQGQADAAQVARAAGAIEGATRRQVQMVEDLLDVSRAIAGKLTLDLAPIDLRALVAGVVEGAMPLAEARRVTLTLAPDGGSPGCLGDAGRLQQVVLNLLTNAIKFTPEGGRVDLTVDSRDGLARLVVADTGRGIAADFLPHLFERFAQEPSESGHHTGLGLGLAIAHDLVTLHGGTLQAESPGKGQGATFTVRLPLHDLPAVVPDIEPPPP
jgi:two-component system, chemotaxis family, CheB/CheR fusion protein